MTDALMRSISDSNPDLEKLEIFNGNFNGYVMRLNNDNTARLHKYQSCDTEP